MHHFTRGFNDGDGGNYIKDGKPLSTFTSNPRFIDDMAEYLKKELNIDIYVYKYEERDTAYLSITGFEKLNKYFNYIYKDATIFINRKHKIYLEFQTLYKEHKENFKAKYNEENIVNLHLEGLSRKEISNTLNVSYDNVGKKLRKNRIYD